mmetsp:Transcript_63796/g.94773  ORF Transcript_63796/g.94773 Transcript_63796/m.94773 type:complete len:108 (+) Transcript_63796:280-603(+)
MLSTDDFTHKRCNCRKSRCLKKYCECFFTKTFCSGACSCLQCENYEGSKMLMDTLEKGEEEKQKEHDRKQIRDGKLKEKLIKLESVPRRSSTVNIFDSKKSPTIFSI